MTDDHVLVVGGGLGAAHTAATLREESYGGRITVVTEEPHRPYERPPLSKEVLTGSAEPDVVYVHEDGWEDEHDVDLVVGDAVTALDVTERTATLGSGARLEWSSLVLATGARPVVPDLDGVDLDGVRTLRTIEDSVDLRDAFGAAERVVVIGASWIGCESASAARAAGADVTLVDMVDVPFAATLGREVGEVIAAEHRAHGVRLALGTSVRALRGDGRVEAVELDDGTRLDADVVVVGVGVRPRTELAEAAGLDVDDGILVDESLRTSAEGVWAIGDVANAWHPFYGRRIRTEHWDTAQLQGQAAARSVLDHHVSYDELPFFWSDQHELGMEYVGHAADVDDVVIRGDREAREIVAFYRDEGRVVACMHAGVWGHTDDFRRIIRSRERIDAARLTDPDVSLEDL